MTRLIVITIALASILTACAKSTPEPYEVVGKCEHDGKCYVETWIEVTPEEYIGLDIGDEFERRD